jgi:predicted DsbA family dithiol-disulfide isomerase
LVQFAQNCAIAGLNQEDILEAIVQKVVSDEEKLDPKKLFRLTDCMLELNL